MRVDEKSILRLVGSFERNAIEVVRINRKINTYLDEISAPGIVHDFEMYSREVSTPARVSERQVSGGSLFPKYI